MLKYSKVHEKKFLSYSALTGFMPRLCLKIVHAFSTTLLILSEIMPSKMGYKVLKTIGVISSSIVKEIFPVYCLLLGVIHWLISLYKFSTSLSMSYLEEPTVLVTIWRHKVRSCWRIRGFLND